jgi:hypothetical protein
VASSVRLCHPHLLSLQKHEDSWQVLLKVLPLAFWDILLLTESSDISGEIPLSLLVAQTECD